MLFEEQVARKPNLYPWTQEFVDKIWSGFWTANEFSFQSDVLEFRSELSESERGVVVRALSAIGQVEIAVKKFWARLGDNLPHPSIQDLGYAMANTEVIHNQAYEKLLDRLRLNDVFEENLKNPIVAGRVNYLRKYNEKNYADDRQQYIYAIILFTLFVENVSLFSQFYVILWLNRFKAILKDTAQQVQYTRNEETLHAQVGIRLIQTLRSEYPSLFTQDLEERVRTEAMNAFTAESAVIDWIMGDHAEDGLSPEVLKAYIQNRIDESMVSIGYQPIFRDFIDRDALNKTYWMTEGLMGNNVTDFFHKRPVDYSKNDKSYSEEDVFGV